jgi:hypothetical protein
LSEIFEVVCTSKLNQISPLLGPLDFNQVRPQASNPSTFKQGTRWVPKCRKGYCWHINEMQQAVDGRIPRTEMLRAHSKRKRGGHCTNSLTSAPPEGESPDLKKGPVEKRRAKQRLASMAVRLTLARATIFHYPNWSKDRTLVT